MKLKAGQAQGILTALVSVKGSKLPVKTAYWLARTATQLGTEVTAFEETRKGLLGRYGKKDEDGKLVTDEGGAVDFEDFEGFKVAFAELADEEFEIKMGAISLDSFEDPDGATLITTEVMAGLLPLIKEPDGE